MDVTLRPVTRENVRAVCDLELAPGQERLVAPAAYTVAEGHYLVRFMIDAAHQGAGTGRQAIALLKEELRAGGWSVLETSFQPVDGGAEGFWRGCGFEDTGRRLHGEPVFAHPL